MRRLRPLFYGLLAAACSTSAWAQALDPATRAATEQAAVQALKQHYILPARLADLPKRLDAQRARLDAATDAPAFAQALGQLLAELTQDKHVRVAYSPQPLPADLAPTAGSLEQERQVYRYLNQGVVKVERLPGNLGYLDLRAFPSREHAAPKLLAAMQVLADTEALIIDLRKNEGGLPETVAYLSSFFVKERTHLNDVVWRTEKGEETESFHTEAVGLSYPHPVWVLISPRSVSAAEGFAYNLRQLKRVQIAGQNSAGAAHPGGMHRLGEHFSLFVPSGRAANPYSGTNWEGVGVQPDLKVAPEDDALRLVQLQLLEGLQAKAQDPRLQRGLRARVQELQAAAPKS